MPGRNPVSMKNDTVKTSAKVNRHIHNELMILLRLDDQLYQDWLAEQERLYVATHRHLMITAATPTSSTTLND